MHHGLQWKSAFSIKTMKRFREAEVINKDSCLSDQGFAPLSVQPDEALYSDILFP